MTACRGSTVVPLFVLNLRTRWIQLRAPVAVPRVKNSSTHAVRCFWAPGTVYLIRKVHLSLPIFIKLKGFYVTNVGRIYYNAHTGQNFSKCGPQVPRDPQNLDRLSARLFWSSFCKLQEKIQRYSLFWNVTRRRLVVIY
jgi:hypothetical protein